MNFFNHYKTLVISDIPLGASPENFKKLIYFIKNTSCDKLILSGDIIKGWQSKKIGNLYKLQNKFIKTLIKVSERDNTEIIFVTGNEWDYKENIHFFKFSKFSFVKEYRFKSGGNIFEVIPEDISDLINIKNLELFQLHKLKYAFLLWLNKRYNSYRINQGKNYYSLLKWFGKNTQKESGIDPYLADKFNLLNLSAKNESIGVICAHQASSGIYHLGSITILNSGYWTETLAALAESNYGKWEIVSFEKIVNDVLEAMHHSDIIEELFEAEKNMISLNASNLTET